MIGLGGKVGFVPVDNWSLNPPFLSLGLKKAWIDISSNKYNDVIGCTRYDSIYKQSGGAGAFYPAIAGGNTNDYWKKVTRCPVTGDMFAASAQGGIYKITHDDNLFSSHYSNTNYGNTSDRGLHVDQSGNLLFQHSSYRLYKQNNATGTPFQISTQDPIFIESSSSSNVYFLTSAENYTGKIYKYNGSTVSLQSSSDLKYTSVCFDLDGNVYVSVYNGDIYKQTNGTGSFVAMNAGDKYWKRICSDKFGNIWGCVYDGGIYKKSYGSNEFVNQEAGDRAYYSIHAADNGNVYACVYNGYIYKQTNAA